MKKLIVSIYVLLTALNIFAQGTVVTNYPYEPQMSNGQTILIVDAAHLTMYQIDKTNVSLTAGDNANTNGTPQAWSGTNYFTNPSNTFTGTFTGSGPNLTNLNPANLSAGNLPATVTNTAPLNSANLTGTLPMGTLTASGTNLPGGVLITDGVGSRSYTNSLVGLSNITASGNVTASTFSGGVASTNLTGTVPPERLPIWIWQTNVLYSQGSATVYLFTNNFLLTNSGSVFIDCTAVGDCLTNILQGSFVQEKMIKYCAPTSNATPTVVGASLYSASQSLGSSVSINATAAAGGLVEMFTGGLATTNNYKIVVIWKTLQQAGP
jgi:hypothetical protein